MYSFIMSLIINVFPIGYQYFAFFFFFKSKAHFKQMVREELGKNKFMNVDKTNLEFLFYCLKLFLKINFLKAISGLNSKYIL